MLFQEDLKNRIETMHSSVTAGKEQIKLITEGAAEEKVAALRELELTSVQLKRLTEEFKQRCKDLMVDVSGGGKIFRPDYEVIVECIAPDKKSKKREVIDKNGLFFAQLEPFKVVEGRVVEVTIKNDQLPIESFRALQHFQELKKVELLQNSIPSLAPLIGSKSVQQLSIANPKVKMDISAAGALPNLRTLEIFGGKISSAELALLFSSTSLEELLLGANAITGLDGIERLAQLKRLNLSRNPVQDILPLTKLPKLEQLSFDVKHGLDLSPLLNCSSLQQLNLTYLTDKAGLFTSWYSKRPGGHIVKALTARGVVVNTRTAS